jgi:acyl-CoA thioesterase YciA
MNKNEIEKKASSPQIRVVMLPKDTNAMGTIFGGVILSYIDLAAAQHAVSIKPHLYVTKVMREVDFIAPVKVGDSVSFYTETAHKGSSSITVKVLVTAERGVTRRKEIKVTEAEVVMVAVNKEGHTVKIF